MKTHTIMMLASFAVAVTLMAAPAVYAQQNFNAELGNGRWSAVEPPLSAAYPNPEYFNAEVGDVPQSEPFSTQGGQGEANSAGGRNSVEVSEIVEDDYAPEGQSIYVLVTHKVPVQTVARKIALEGR